MRQITARLIAVLFLSTASLSAGTVTVSNLNASGAGSLADAIDRANNGVCADPCTITFSIAGTIPFSGKTISASDVVIDGSSAPGATKNHGGFPGPFIANVTVGVTGSATSANAFTLGGKNITISALSIQNYTGDAILIDGNLGAASDNTVEGCIILGNRRGVTVQNAARNLIGTGRPATNPILAGNGTGSPGDRNVIAGSTDWDVAFINSTNNAASGNFLGVAADGVTPVTSGTGVFISGGSTNGAGGGSGNNSNVIGGHTAEGIRVTGGATGTLINGNYVGININNGAVANTAGIRIDGGAAATIGGIQRNVISGNGTGIYAGNPSASGRVVIQGGNLIGTDSSGTSPVANSGYGIRTAANTAGNLYVTGNTIAFNGAGGILPGGVGAEVRGTNVIYSNGGQNVDLAGDGSFIANDAGDADTGNDNRQNYPDITSARIVSGTLMFNATVDSSSVGATNAIAIDVWKADATGGARTYLGTSGCVAGRNLQSVALQMSGAALADGDKIVATATSYANTSCTTLSDGTSQISPAVPVCVAPPAAITIDSGATYACATSPGHVASVVNSAGATYAWTIYNGTITAGQGTSSITFTAGSAGTATVSVAASFGACTNNSSSSITVRALPAAFINGPSSACAGVPFTLTAAAGYASYLWSTGATTQSISVSQSAQTTYSVTVSDGFCSGTTSKTVVMAFPADATITAPASVCAGTSGVTASVPFNPSATFSWTISGGTVTSSTTANSITFDVPVNSAGVTLNVTANANGCSTSGAKSVGVNPLPAAAISAPASVCANATGITASTPVVAGATYAWTVTGGTISAGAGTDTITFNAASNATTIALGLTVTTPSNCHAIDSASIAISPATIPLTAPASACANATGVSASVASAAGASYVWSVTGGTISGGQGTNAITFNVNASVSSVNVGVTRTLGGCSASASQAIPIGAPDATITAPASVCPGSSAQASVPASGGATYAWTISGATITAGDNTNSITFQPIAGSSTIALGVTVNGNACSASSSRNVTVAGTPQVTISAPPTITQNTSGNASASSNLTSTFAWTITNGAITSGQGTSAITFTAGTGPSTVLSLTATAGSCSASASASIATIVPISITTPSLPIGAMNDPYSATVTAAGGAPPYTFAVLNGTLPDGLSLSASGAISGTPTRIMTTNVDIQVTDGTRTAVKSFQMRVVNGLTVATTSLPNGNIGVQYSATLAAAGGASPLTWALNGGSLPAGLNLLPNGTITGTPSADGTSNFTVEVTDSHAVKARGFLSITIGAALQIVTGALPNAPLGTDFSFVLAASGGTRPYVWSIAAGALPAGLTLSPDGTISGKSTARELAHVTIRVTDANGATAERQFVMSTDCSTAALQAPKAAAVREVTTDVPYSIGWHEIPGASSFEIQESLSDAFAGADPATLSDLTLEFAHHVEKPTAYFYRVRAVSSCSGAKSEWSNAIRVVIVPIGDPHAREFHITAPFGTERTILVPIFIDGSESAHPLGLATTFVTAAPPPPPPANAPFSATSSASFVNVTPATGTVPPFGTTITAAVSPGTLPPGTSSTVISVTNAATGAPITSVPLSVSLTSPVLPSPASSVAAQSLIIPAVAHVDGQSATFASDLRIANVTAQASKYEVSFTPWGSLQQSQVTTFSVNSAQTILLNDVVRHLFGFGSLQDGAAGTLAVRRLDTNSDPRATVAWAHMYSGDSLSRVGQFIPSVSLDKFVTLSQTLSMQHLAQSATTRTNLGLIEGGGSPVTLLAKAFDPHGNLLSQFPINLAANEHIQLNSVLLQNGVSSPDARVELTVASGTGRVSAYASVIDNGTNDASLVPAIDATRTSSTRYVIPGVTHVDAGGASWRSDVRIYNPSDDALSLDVSFVPQNTSTPQTRSLAVAPHEVAVLDDIVAQTFGVNDAGALHVSAASATPLVVTGRTYRATDAGALGQFIAATTPQEATAAGEKPLHIVGVEESLAMRTNVGVYETAGSAATIDLTVTTADGRAAAHVALDLQPYEYRQLSSILRSIGYVNTYNATVDISVKSGRGRVGGYASIIENASGDPLYVPAQ